jgi:hypothetical protein
MMCFSTNIPSIAPSYIHSCSTTEQMLSPSPPSTATYTTSSPLFIDRWIRAHRQIRLRCVYQLRRTIIRLPRQHGAQTPTHNPYTISSMTPAPSPCTRVSPTSPILAPLSLKVSAAPAPTSLAGAESKLSTCTRKSSPQSPAHGATSPRSSARVRHRALGGSYGCVSHPHNPPRKKSPKQPIQARLLLNSTRTNCAKRFL